MSVIVRLYPNSENGNYAKSKRNLDLKVKRFAKRDDKRMIRARIMASRDYKCKALREWYPIGHILIIHHSDFEYWIPEIRRIFGEWTPSIERIIDLEKS